MRSRTHSGRPGATALRDAVDLLRKDAEKFYENIVRKRLNRNFAQVDRYLAMHFYGADPLRRGGSHNLD